MKKRFKGLVALIMAMAMVVSVAPNTYGAISDEVYEEKSSEYNYVKVYSSYIDTSPKYSGISDWGGEPIEVGFEIKDYIEKYGYENFTDGLYTDIIGWKIWGRTQNGGYDVDNTKEVA